MAGGKPLAFCDAHKAGPCSVAWLPAAGGRAAAALLTAGPDGRLCYRNPEAPAEVVKDITNSCQGTVGPVHVLAAAEGRPVVTGDDQNFAKASKAGCQGLLGAARHGAWHGMIEGRQYKLSTHALAGARRCGSRRLCNGTQPSTPLAFPTRVCPPRLPGKARPTPRQSTPAREACLPACVHVGLR